MKSSIQELASRAASQAMAEAAKSITPPNSAYQFEVSWRRLSSDKALQALYLKVGNFPWYYNPKVNHVLDVLYDNLVLQ